MAGRGRFISFEGTDGCGKSTQIRELRRRLLRRGREVVLTREPGGTVAGERIRHLLQHHPDASRLCPEAELLLFTASRAQLVRELLLPSLERGAWIIADRFHDSTTVYQGMARGLDRNLVETINRFAVADCVPDLTVLLDLDIGQARHRLEGRPGSPPDRMEAESAAFFEAVRSGYLQIARENPERVVVLDGSGTIGEIAATVWSCVNTRFDGLSD